jgi:putative zinc finger/helix-turn-helix YgiT family protein
MKCYQCGKEMKKAMKDYPYLEAGLDNVVLKDLPVYICECGEEMPVIGGADTLHAEIADAIAAKSSPLTGKEARFLRKQIDMKAKELAEVMGVTKVTVSRWENDAANLGAASDRLLRLIYVKKREEETGRIRKGIIGALKSIETAKGEGGPHHEKVITVKAGGKKSTRKEIA